MKQSKKLTYKERSILASWGLNPTNWRRGNLYPDKIQIVNRVTNEVREIPNYRKGETR